MENITESIDALLLLLLATRVLAPAASAYRRCPAVARCAAPRLLASRIFVLPLEGALISAGGCPKHHPCLVALEHLLALLSSHV